MAQRRASLKHTIYVGTAGWTLPPEVREAFPDEGTHLQRYAERLSAVEINSTFYRSHRMTTFARWAESVPAGFRFSVKVPRTMTHDRRLTDIDEPLARFLDETAPLGDRLGCLLVQLPPSLACDRQVATALFRRLRQQTNAPVALEPRHASWFEPDVEKLLVRYKIARVAADPAKVPAAALPGGWREMAYYRLHGSPRTYYSSYSAEYLSELAATLALQIRPKTSVWCIFDNTALGAAAANALELQKALAAQKANRRG